MKIVVTGSLGNISRPLTQELIEKGHSVTVISHSQERQGGIEDLGAKAAIGTMNDTDFLSKTFTGADMVYLMEPPFDIFDQNINLMEFYTHIAKSYAAAILQSGVKKVVHLSSIGAHTTEGIGMLGFHYEVEKILRSLPADVSIKFIRPVVFYLNMFSFIPTIKAQNAIFQNYGGDDKKPWVSPLDIAAAIAEEMEKPFAGREVRYIASDEVSPNEIAKVLGKTIGKPDLQWITVSDDDLINGMAAAGISPHIAKGFAATNTSTAILDGVLYEDYNRNKPTLGKVKFEDFAEQFKSVYENQ